MYSEVEEYCRTCERCQQIKTRQNIPKPPLRPIIAREPLERVEIDFTEMDHSDPVTGDRYILTVVDCCTKFAWTKTFKTKHAAPVALAEFLTLKLGTRARSTLKRTAKWSD
eukprot:TRINITY_DN5039_c0_g1_i1.p1 TRINITY_DN5039_c0_g1~~TRINITY_DN5039_c0_g1_i1.p1  ORF type:complete len:111 (+),score=16.53 TRINITY_DN5039_c0_g1_i1:259-591(+)